MQTKVTSMSYGSTTNSWKPWKCVRLDKIFTMRDIWINSNLTQPIEITSSNKTTEFEDTLPWNISQKTLLISTRIVINYAMISDISFWVWWKVNGNWHSNMIKNGGKAIVEQILTSKGNNKSKRAGIWESQPGIQVGKLNIWVRSFETQT